MMPRQTVLPPDARGDVSFGNFVGSANGALLKELQQLVAGRRSKRVLYFWGEAGCGKTHLLNACCHGFSKFGNSPVYISLGQQNHRPELLDAVDPETLVCIDDLQIVAGLEQPQVRIMSLYESLVSRAGALVVSGNSPLSELGLVLKDLESRLSSGGIYHLQALNDAEKKFALKARAHERGFSLEDHVIDFIMSHYQRDTRSLFSLLDRLDSASLQAQRKITIPFVKQLL